MMRGMDLPRKGHYLQKFFLLRPNPTLVRTTDAVVFQHIMRLTKIESLGPKVYNSGILFTFGYFSKHGYTSKV